MARPSERVPFTSKIWKRYDKGASFIVMTGFYLYLTLILTLVYIPEFSQHYSTIFTGFVYLLSFGLGLMSYWCFYKASITNPGDVDVNFSSPMPNPMDRDEPISPEENSKTDLQHFPSENIYDKILRFYSKYAIQREIHDNLNQTSTTDVENPGGFVLPKDQMTRNCIMNNYCYKHCKKCKIDQPPRARH